MEFTLPELDRVFYYAQETRKEELADKWHRTSFLAAHLYNASRGKRGKVVKPEDFFKNPPWVSKRVKKNKSKEQQKRELADLKKKFGE